jgi:GNAT superfamily N-acetyltransferase
LQVGEGLIKVYSGGITPSSDQINEMARMYVAAFNTPPWDIYQWNLNQKRSCQEIIHLVHLMLSSPGALFTLSTTSNPDAEIQRSPKLVGFNIVVLLDLFVKRLAMVEKFKKIPRDFRSPRDYFHQLSSIFRIPLADFYQIGYLADIVVDSGYRGRGFGTSLLAANLEYLRNAGSSYALAWTINQFSSLMLERHGFQPIAGMGYEGQGLDFLFLGKIWYPTLTFPTGALKVGESVIAKHYFKKL